MYHIKYILNGLIWVYHIQYDYRHYRQVQFHFMFPENPHPLEGMIC